MKEVIGNIWNFHDRGHWIVIPINKTLNKDDHLVMGAGLALEAKTLFPDLPELWGSQMLFREGKWGVYIDDRISIKLIGFPTKDRWWEKSTLALIEEGLKFLVSDTFAGILIHRLSQEVQKSVGMPEEIYLPRLGCGLGGLDWESQVKPLMEKYLVDDRFIVVNKE